MSRSSAVRTGLAAAAAATLIALPAGLLVLSDAGRASLIAHEAVRTEAYLDPIGIPTICVGHIHGVYLGQKRTLKECEALLDQDATYAGRAIARCTKVDLTQEQYDALVSFTFNVGGAAYCNSTLARKLNANDCWGAAAQFDRWAYAGGKHLRGLAVRRADERRRFESGCLRGVA